MCSRHQPEEGADSGQPDEGHLYQKIRAHWGHKIEIAIYGPADDPVNAAVECLDCYEVVVDEDRYPPEG